MLRRASLLGIATIVVGSMAVPAFGSPITITFTWALTTGSGFVGPNWVDSWTVPDPIPPLALGNSYQQIDWAEPEMADLTTMMSMPITYDPETHYIAVAKVRTEESTFAFPQKQTVTAIATMHPDGHLWWEPGPAVYSDYIDVVSHVDWYEPQVLPWPEPATLSLVSVGLLAMARRLVTAARH